MLNVVVAMAVPGSEVFATPDFVTLRALALPTIGLLSTQTS
jgi:hypothetical protein